MKWEYKVVYSGSLMLKTNAGAAKMIQQKCDELGEQGWEMVSCPSYDMGSKFMLVFKRPKNE